MSNSLDMLTILQMFEAEKVDVIKHGLEKGPDDHRVELMKMCVSGLLNGDNSYASCLMHVIRFVVPSKNKQLKRLFFMFLEGCPKSVNGKLLNEMILVCNALRNDLLHANEYVRGSCLRLMCKIKEKEIVEPLVQPLIQCLEHRNSYVRKNAVIALYSVHQSMKALIPNAPQQMLQFLIKEQDMEAKRNALLCLFKMDQNLTLSYVKSALRQTKTFDQGMQMAFIQVLRDLKMSSKVLFEFLHLGGMVSYEAAMALFILEPESAKQCIHSLCSILTKTIGNNGKIIVLQKLLELLTLDRYDDEVALELLKTLLTPDLEVRRLCLLALRETTTSRNIEQVCLGLTQNLNRKKVDLDSLPEYRQLLVQTIHHVSMRYPNSIKQSVNLVLDLCCDSCYLTAVEVVSFLKETLFKFDLKNEILQKLIPLINSLKSGKVMRGVLWILGEYLEQDYNDFLNQIKLSLQIPDTTTQSPFQMTAAPISPKFLQDKKPPLEALLNNNDYYTFTVLATCLSKLCLKQKNEDFNNECLSILHKVLDFGVNNNLDEDSLLRIQQCKQCILEQTKEVFEFAKNTKIAFKTHLSGFDVKQKQNCLDPINFKFLKHKKQQQQKQTKKRNVLQLTGFSDKVYAEAFVNVNKFDVVLDILVVNMTNSTLQNLCLEFAAVGDLKVFEKIPMVTLAPKSYYTVKTHIKVSCTESGTIMGNIVFEKPEPCFICLENITIDITDYICPKTCSDALFRAMWVEFEWENKITISCDLEIMEFLNLMQKQTNLMILNQVPSTCVVAANFYAKSVFGEDALANVCIQRFQNKIQGHVRIRSKTQQIALGLGEKISKIK